MLCNNCNENEANFRYTEIINGVKKEIALCEECKKKLGLQGLDFNIPIGMPSFFSDFFESSTFMPEFDLEKSLKCELCGMTYDEFINNGKLGCSNCYDTFESKLDYILNDIHGANRHKGRLLNSVKTAKEKLTKNKEANLNNDKLEKLKNELKQLIKEEKYEEAAKIRDEIKKLGKE